MDKDYPDNMLVRFVSDHYYNVPNRKEVKFLDVGCNTGAATWYLSREGFSVASIGTSPLIMEALRNRLLNDNLEAFLGCGDFTKLEFKPDYFDAIIDVSSLCYVPKNEIGPLMRKLHTVLKPGGRFFSITPTNESSEIPFTKTVDGIEVKARFQTFLEAKYNFNDFSEVETHTCSYDRGKGENWQHINILTIEAVK